VPRSGFVITFTGYFINSGGGKKRESVKEIEEKLSTVVVRNVGKSPLITVPLTIIVVLDCVILYSTNLQRELLNLLFICDLCTRARTILSTRILNNCTLFNYSAVEAYAVFKVNIQILFNKRTVDCNRRNNPLS